MLKYCCFFLMFFLRFSVFSQKKYSKEFSFVTDNDLFVSISKDRYYSNGVFFSYRFLSKNKKETQEKRIFEWQLGHEIYTPFKSVVPHISLHDRPFAANFFGSFGVNRIYKNDEIFKTSVSVGVLGPAAFGRELQDFIHEIYGFNKGVGWDHQIQNAVGLNFSASYIKPIVKISNFFDITWVNEAKLGTIYTNISSGFYTRIRFKPLQNLVNSIAFDTAINNEKNDFNKEFESFLYVKTMLRYSEYDATLQGSFLNNNNDVTKELVPVQFHLETGIRFTTKRWNFGYAFQFHSNKSKGLHYQNGNIFGTIRINYFLGEIF